MKSLSSLKSNKKLDSPKTPGGISKSLLTPCRRVGLSRNWRNSGPSPFISPLSGNAAEGSVEKKETRKRKEVSDEQVCDTESTEKNDNEEITSKSSVNAEVNKSSTCDNIDTTPSRNISLPRRKKSKSMVISRIQITTEESPVCGSGDPVLEENTNNSSKNLDVKLVSENIVATPIRVKSVGKIKKLSCSTIINESNLTIDKEKENLKDNTDTDKLQKTAKPKSPENLTKECIVVIQKKIFKNALETKNKAGDVVSQALFDSDTDDVPLSVINKPKEKEANKNSQQEIINVDDESDFIENTKVKVKKLKDKTTSTGGLKSKPNVKKKVKEKYEIVNSKAVTPTESKLSSQTSFDDDEDFVMDKKRTIIIRKSYDKVSKPCKAKSTGSITQQDIDELKARIEMKKKLLLAKATGTDTEELRTLIKKWQKGCQDALMELMELMKIKCQDNKNMDYSQILETLKIPADLVGYDEENDCFGTPTDESIVLSKFNDL